MTPPETLHSWLRYTAAEKIMICFQLILESTAKEIVWYLEGLLLSFDSQTYY